MSNPFSSEAPPKPVKPPKDPFGDQKKAGGAAPTNPFASGGAKKNPFADDSKPTPAATTHQGKPAPYVNPFAKDATPATLKKTPSETTKPIGNIDTSRNVDPFGTHHSTPSSLSPTADEIPITRAMKIDSSSVKPFIPVAEVSRMDRNTVLMAEIPNDATSNLLGIEGNEHPASSFDSFAPSNNIQVQTFGESFQPSGNISFDSIELGIPVAPPPPVPINPPVAAGVCVDSLATMKTSTSTMKPSIPPPIPAQPSGFAASSFDAFVPTPHQGSVGGFVEESDDFMASAPPPRTASAVPPPVPPRTASMSNPPRPLNSVLNNTIGLSGFDAFQPSASAAAATASAGANGFDSFEPSNPSFDGFSASSSTAVAGGGGQIAAGGGGGFDDFHAGNDNDGFSATTNNTAPAAVGFHGSAVRVPSFHDSFGAMSMSSGSAPPAVPAVGAVGAGFATMDGGDGFEPSPSFGAGHSSGSGFDDGFSAAAPASHHHHGFVEYRDESEFPPPASDQYMDVFMPPPPVPPPIPAAPATSHQQQLPPQSQPQSPPQEDMIPGLPALAPQLDLDDFEQSFAYRLREIEEMEQKVEQQKQQQAQQAPRRPSATATNPATTASSSGNKPADPFAVLVKPLKPNEPAAAPVAQQPAVAPSGPAMSLNQLKSQVQQQQAPPVNVFINRNAPVGGSSTAPAAALTPSRDPQQLQQQQVPQAFASPVNPFKPAPATTPQYDSFDVFSTPSRPAGLAKTASITATPPVAFSDPFASSHPTAAAAVSGFDDFDSGFASTPAPAAAVEPSFDMFSPSTAAATAVPAAKGKTDPFSKPAPQPVAKGGDDFDIFSPKAPKATQLEPLQQHQYDIFSPKGPVLVPPGKAAPPAAAAAAAVVPAATMMDEFDAFATTAPVSKSTVAGGKSKPVPAAAAAPAIDDFDVFSGASAAAAAAAAAAVPTVAVKAASKPAVPPQQPLNTSILEDAVDDPFNPKPIAAVNKAPVKSAAAVIKQTANTAPITAAAAAKRPSAASAAPAAKQAVAGAKGSTAAAAAGGRSSTYDPLSSQEAFDFASSHTSSSTASSGSHHGTAAAAAAAASTVPVAKSSHQPARPSIASVAAAGAPSATATAEKASTRPKLVMKANPPLAPPAAAVTASAPPKPPVVVDFFDTEETHDDDTDSNPFGVKAVVDPFAASSSPPAATVGRKKTIAPAAAHAAPQPMVGNLLGDDDMDDPFGMNAAFQQQTQTQAHATQQRAPAAKREDAIAKLRQAYNLDGEEQSEVNTEEQEAEEGEGNGDDDEEDFDRRHFQKNKKAETSTNSSSAGGGKEGEEAHPLSKEGDILIRLSTRSLVTKDWSEAWYIFEGDSLYIYHNKLDYQYNPKDKNYKRKIDIKPTLRLLKINAKDYRGYGTVYNFMMEEVLDFGPSNIGKFGSVYRPALEILWNELRDRILEKRRLKANPPKQYGR